MRPVDLVGIQLEVSTGSPVLILREHDEPHRLLPIFVGGPEAAAIAVAGKQLARPLTHDLMAALVHVLDGHVDAVEVTDFDDGTYLANLTISGPTGEHRVDTRPSDAIALAVRLGAPLFVSEEVLDVAGSMPDDSDDERDAAIDEARIDAELDEFRRFLGEITAADFDESGPIELDPPDDAPDVPPTEADD